MILIRRLTALLTQLLMIQFVILSGAGSCPMTDESATAGASAMTRPLAAAPGLHGVDTETDELRDSPVGAHERGQPTAPHNHDAHHTSSHCAQSCVPGACSSTHCATVSIRDRAALAPHLSGGVDIPAGREGVPSWFARAPEPPPPRA